MEFSSLSPVKSCGQRYLSPLARAHRRQAYIPKNLKVLDVKNILQKFLDVPKELQTCDGGIRKSENRTLKQKLNLSPSAQKQKVRSEVKQVRCFSPSVGVIRNGRSIRKVGGGQRVRVGKNVEFEEEGKGLKELEGEGSLYTSYSDIYKGLLEKIPLVY